MNLKNKRILFIAPKFYNYHVEIIKIMEKKGAQVIFYPEMVNSLLYRVGQKINQRIKKHFDKKYLQFLLENIEENSFDFFFLIRGELLTIEFLTKLRLKLPNAKFLMYQWDSIRQNDYVSKIDYFDIVQTFDKVDAKVLNIGYLPLYYMDVYKNLNTSTNNKKYDLAFFGAYHSDRLKIIKLIDSEFKRQGLSFYFHLYITRLAMLRFLLIGKISFQDIHYLRNFSVTTGTILEIYSQSKAVLDVELFIQNGLTMRTFETLGAGLKLVTTNKNIKDEHFYNHKNIMIIDRNSLHIDMDFFKDNFSFDNSFENYSFENWIENIFDFENSNKGKIE